MIYVAAIVVSSIASGVVVWAALRLSIEVRRYRESVDRFVAALGRERGGDGPSADDESWRCRL